MTEYLRPDLFSMLEKHNTKRHLNEYTSLDFEMGYIDSFEEIMAMETGFCSMQ